MPMDEVNASKPKNKYTIIAIVIAVAAAAGLLIFVARGRSYDITVQDPFRGADGAPVVIEEFSDFQCPACRNAVVIVKEAVNQYPNQVKFVYRDFPLPDHAYARLTATAGLCAAQQNKFWEFHDIVFEKQPEWSVQDRALADQFLSATASELGLNVSDFDVCRRSRQAQSEVDRDFKEGVERGVNSTPSFFINGVKVEPTQAGSVFQWTQTINQELQKKGLTPENQPAS